MNRFKLVVKRILADGKKKTRILKSLQLASAENADSKPSQCASLDIVQNYRLVWLDLSHPEKEKTGFASTLSQLRVIVNTIDTFTDVELCLDLITTVKNETIFLIMSGIFAPTTMATVHNLSQVSSIYILRQEEEDSELLEKQWCKIKGVFTEVSFVCEGLRQDACEHDQNFISISFISTNNRTADEDLNFVDSSFVCSALIKDVISTMDVNEQHLTDFIQYCREQFVHNAKEYQQHAPVCWYTHSCLLSSMLNRALNTMDINLLFRMDFLIRDLHENIVQLHAKQYLTDRQLDPFHAYRGQGLPLTIFNQLIKTKGGFMSMNNFFTASKDRDLSLQQARQSITNPDLMGVLFVLVIDPSVTSTAFASMQHIDDQNTDEQIIFTLNSVFRIEKIEQIDVNNDRLWQVKIALTRNDDSQFCQLIDYIKEETFPRKKGWHRLGRTLIKFDQFDKAQQMYQVMLNRTFDDHEKADIYHMLGWIKDNQEEYPEAISFYEKSIKIKNINSPTRYLDLASSYNNIGGVYDQLGEYRKALSAHRKALAIREDHLSQNHPDLAMSFNNIAGVYNNMDDCSPALFFYTKALEICQNLRPLNLPYLATSYNNIALVHETMENYTSALHFHEKALEIRRKILPFNQIDLAQSYNNIAGVYDNLGNCWKALEFYQHALEILQYSVSANHPNLRCVRYSIELVKREL